jgi:uncharacterized protein (DUF1778 family)
MKQEANTSRRSLKGDQPARDAVKDSEVLTLDNEARNIFVNAILHPPAANEPARKAAQRYKGQIGR